MTTPIGDPWPPTTLQCGSARTAPDMYIRGSIYSKSTWPWNDLYLTLTLSAGVGLHYEVVDQWFTHIGAFISQIPPHRIWHHFIWTGSLHAVAATNHSAVSSDKTRSVKIRSNDVRWNYWYERFVRRDLYPSPDCGAPPKLPYFGHNYATGSSEIRTCKPE